MNGSGAGAIAEDAVPPALVDLVRAWRVDGQATQPGIAWPKDRWIESFPMHATTLRDLPAFLDRSAVAVVGAAAGDDIEAAAAAFIAVLAWGYGRVGYGVWRAKRALAAPGAAGHLLEAVAALRHEGALAGYASLAQRTHRLPSFGPAFGTKFLALCAGVQVDPPPLILDGLVARWLEENTGFRVNPVPWSVSTYRRYFELMVAWAGALDIAAESLELCIFTEESRRAGNQWATTSATRSR